MQKTTISWTNYSANPLRSVSKATGKRGHMCVLASAGCINCYSQSWNIRLGTGLRYTRKNSQAVEVILDEQELLRMSRIRRGVKVFVCDMTDLFGEFVTDAQIARIVSVMRDNAGVTWQVLTKRPARMRQFVNEWRWQHIAPSAWNPRIRSWPVNIWLGTSCEDQQTANARIPELVNIKHGAANTHITLFLSLEPFLGPIEIGQAMPCGYYCDERVGHIQHPFWSRVDPKINWVIVGGESGRRARPCELTWIADLLYQCKGVDVPVFVKQVGSVQAKSRQLKDSKGSDPTEWPPSIRVQDFPQKEEAAHAAV